MQTWPLIAPRELLEVLADVRLLDCRFSLADPALGEQQYRQGHIPGASYIHLEQHLSAPIAAHGGRHPLPDPQLFCALLASLGIGTDTPVVAYDSSGFAFSGRAWWMMEALGFRDVRVLDGGLEAWKQMGAALDTQLPLFAEVAVHQSVGYGDCLDVDGLREAQAAGARLVDSREEVRFLGLEEPIDSVAGHIPGAVNYPWDGVCDSAGRALAVDEQKQRWASLAKEPIVVYCGSGVTACVNVLSLRMAGVEGAKLYAGSWSDWCSYL